MEKVFLGLGSNIGDKKSNILKAVKILSKEIKNIKVASFYISKAVGYTDQNDFVNTVLKGYTELSPYQLLQFCQFVEKEVGRIYRFKWGPREIDIDILTYGNLVINSEDLKIPHPFLEERDFVLIPLRDIEPNFVHPVSKKKLEELIKNIKFKSIIGSL